MMLTGYSVLRPMAAVRLVNDEDTRDDTMAPFADPDMKPPPPRRPKPCDTFPVEVTYRRTKPESWGAYNHLQHGEKMLATGIEPSDTDPTGWNYQFGMRLASTDWFALPGEELEPAPSPRRRRRTVNGEFMNTPPQPTAAEIYKDNPMFGMF